MDDEEVRQVIANYDAAHPQWEAREAQEREAKEAKEAREQQQQIRHGRVIERQQRQAAANNANNAASWWAAIDQRIAQHLDEQWTSDAPNPLMTRWAK